MSITSSNAVVMLSIANLFNAPQQLQGFSADEVYSTDPIAPAEVVMGVDGQLSGGYVFVQVPQNFMLQADSPSVAFFDQWNNANRALGDNYTANGIITLRSLGTKWAMTKGFLTGYPPIPDARKILQPRRFQITWERVEPAAG